MPEDRKEEEILGTREGRLAIEQAAEEEGGFLEGRWGHMKG